MHHSELLGKSDEELLRLAPEATHQHFKGGLYRYLGPLMDADTGEQMSKDTVWEGVAEPHPYIAYEHLFPYERKLWTRSHEEFFGKTSLAKHGQVESRYRELKR